MPKRRLQYSSSKMSVFRLPQCIPASVTVEYLLAEKERQRVAEEGFILIKGMH